MVDGRMVYSSEALPESSRQEAVYYDDEPAKEPWASQEPREIIDPELREATYGDDAFVEVYLRFEDPLVLPQFYVADTLEPADSFHNQSIRNKNEQLASAIREARAPFYQHVTDIIESQLEGKVLYESMLNNALTVELPREEVKSLENLPDLQRAYLVSNDLRPLSQTTANGRATIQSDPYYAAYSGKHFAPIALIDTGVRTTHNLLQGAVANSYQCANLVGQTSCYLMSPTDRPQDVDTAGHGTSSASILAANSGGGNNYRGILQGYINSYKIFNLSYSPGAVGNSTLTPFQSAIVRSVLDGNKVISASIGSPSLLFGVIADVAFDNNVAVVAGAGNSGPSRSSIQYPGAAHKVLAVGAIELGPLGGQFFKQSRGPTSDNRVKPDIQAPTATEAASARDDSSLHIYGATSGATPYAAGAAALT
jgi:hypothetical protein